jgi:subtilisin family serine protease
VFVAGAGNENTEEPPYFPAYLQRACMITALDSLDVKADFADFNPEVLVSAPGVGVRSAYPGNDWGIGAGCSFATPLVAGEAALILSLFPELTWTEVGDRIALAVDSIYDIEGNQPYLGKLGTGRIYLPDAVGGAASSPPASEPVGLLLARALPNPTGGSVRIELSGGSLPATIEVRIYDGAGRLIRSVGGEGEAPLIWDGRDASGRPVPSGVYHARLRSPGGTSATIDLRVIR